MGLDGRAAGGHMPVQDLELFQYLVATGSMSQVAREFGVSPAEVSRQISALENRLNTRLFYRPAAGLELTASGLAFHAATILLKIKRGPNAIHPAANDNAARAFGKI